MSSPLGRRLRGLRETAGLSGRELDKLAVVAHGKTLTKGHSQQIETAPNPNPTIETLNALAHVFGVSLDWLVDGSGESPTNESIRIAVAEATRRVASKSTSAA